LIVDREVAIQIEPVGMAAQEMSAKTMERAYAEEPVRWKLDPGTIDSVAIWQQLPDAIAHFAGSFVGEGDGQDFLRPHPLMDQIRHAAGYNARLSAACAGKDEQRPLEVGHRLALGRCQIGK
jgi:hypothetical protein